MIDRASLLIADLERVPELLRGHAEAARQPVPLPPAIGTAPQRIVLTGLGSSRFAALVVAPALVAAGLEVVVEHASTSRPAPLDRATLLVPISSSGRTPETVAAAERGRRSGAGVLVITNQPVSPLGEVADAVLTLDAGAELSGVASVTYAATVAALCRMAASIGVELDARGLLEDAARNVNAVLVGRDAWSGIAADLLQSGAPIHLLADASALGTAEQAALLFREGPRIDADVTDAGDWLHVGLYTALPGYRAVLLSGTTYDRELVDVIHGRGGTVVAVGTAGPDTSDLRIDVPGGSPGLLQAAFGEPVALSLIAAELWTRVHATDRREPDPSA